METIEIVNKIPYLVKTVKQPVTKSLLQLRNLNIDNKIAKLQAEKAENLKNIALIK